MHLSRQSIDISIAIGGSSALPVSRAKMQEARVDEERYREVRELKDEE
jgi:hypothetical protein